MKRLFSGKDGRFTRLLVVFALAGPVYAAEGGVVAPVDIDTNEKVDNPALHPAIPLLDEEGRHVLDSGKPYSPRLSCGSSNCHDYDAITSAYHFEMGRDEASDDFGCLIPGLPFFAAAEEPPVAEKEKTWWEERAQRPDIYYPHNAHQEVMKQEGDPCLLCHPFSNNEVTETQRIKMLTVIANEPLAAICHECHMNRQSASWRCDLCHPEPAAIWPESHDLDYRLNHAEDARLDEGECRGCHLDLGFCIDCHFARDGSRFRVHPLGYRTRHAIEARLVPADCGRCHGARYCSDCHRRVGR